MTRTIVLLGAGASHDAGLPLTSQLAEMLVSKFNADASLNAEVQALNFVYAAMVGHQGEDGSDPLRAVNIETLISAVRLLQARESHEVAPFVASWKPGALGFGQRAGTSMISGNAAQHAVKEAIEKQHFGGEALVRLIEQIARDVSRPREDSVFIRLENALLGGIQGALSDVGSVNYLRPLADLASTQANGLDIVTLNYDRSIEIMAAEVGVTLDTGIERWLPGVPLSFENQDGAINLYKLHGSVDWELVEGDGVSKVISPPKIRIRTDREDDLGLPRSRSHRPWLPWIVVGDREKLATDGPTLDLLHAAAEAFSKADNLVVVGYSFADSHINAIVRNWMAAGVTRRMNVVDLGWPPYGSAPNDPRNHLAVAYGGSDNWNSPAVVAPRITAFPETAALGLSRALTNAPRIADPYAVAEFGTGEASGSVVVRLLGPTLKRVRIHGGLDIGATTFNVLESRELRDQMASRPLSPNNWRSASIGTFEQGAEVSIFPLGEFVTPMSLTLEGYDPVGRRLIRLTVRTAPVD